jgi:F0F1-type ATP synthase assembly protein I
VPPFEPGSDDDEVRKELPRNTRNWMKYSGMAVQMIGIMLVFVFSGIYLDKWLEMSPLFTVVLALAGVAGGLYSALKDFL